MKKWLFVVLSVIMAIGLMGNTFAYFTDVETSTGNTFTVGIFDLQVADADEWFSDGVSKTWTMSDMIPGVTSIGPFSVTLHNSETITADHLEISFCHTIDEISNPVETDSNPESTPGDMARWIEITSMTYDTINFIVSQVDANGNGLFDLEDVTLPPYTDDAGLFDNLPAPVGFGVTTFTMALKFSSLAPNDIQGDILTTTVSFTLNQDASQ